jgi:ribosomal protein L11 methyltransferase
VKIYLEDTDTAGLSRLEEAVKELNLTMNVAALPETNWEESWKDNYPAVEVGKNLIVVPYWQADETNGRTPIILDPGLTFGTGAHASTQMVMEAMEQCVKPGYICLDLGSGSGILSLAALRLGAESAIGVDIDPKAEDIARENAAYNGFAAPHFTALTGNVTADKNMMDALADKHYDLVLVNIVADVIIGLSPVLPHFLTPETKLICSGILDCRLQDVVDALERVGIQITAIHAKEDWRCVEARRSHA